MSRFDEQFGQALAAMLAELGTTVAYRDAATDEVELVAIVGAELAGDLQSERGLTRRRETDVVLPRTDAAAGGGTYLAAVSLSGEIRIDGEWWAIERIQLQTPTETQVIVVRDARHEESRPNYRERSRSLRRGS